jgi:hypothetical protein
MPIDAPSELASGGNMPLAGRIRRRLNAKELCLIFASAGLCAVVGVAAIICLSYTG